MIGFVKLSSGIIQSSIMSESYPTRIVWIAMLAMSDCDGNVFSSTSGLSRAANVTLEETKAALQTFLSPDDDSRTKDFDGKRIEIIDGGWKILNYKKYREFSYSSSHEAVRKRRYRDRKRSDNNDLNQMGHSGTCPGHGGTKYGHSASASASVSFSDLNKQYCSLESFSDLNKHKAETEKKIIKEKKFRDKRDNVDRLKKFETECKSFSEKYGDEMIDEFITYWSETDRGKIPKMRFEKQTTWETGKRLATWHRNQMYRERGTKFISSCDKTMSTIEKMKREGKL